MSPSGFIFVKVYFLSGGDPYPGQGTDEVMPYIHKGGRMERPENCCIEL